MPHLQRLLRSPRPLSSQQRQRQLHPRPRALPPHLHLHLRHPSPLWLLPPLPLPPAVTPSVVTVRISLSFSLAFSLRTLFYLGTFYSTGLGACGITNVDTDFIAAASFLLFDGFNGYTGANPNNNPICGKKVLAHYQGKQVTVTITDRCAGCFGKYNLDFSPSAFSQLADQTVGRIFGMTWNFI
ncbi:RlpA-like double-psi beta-barrel-protein domain-containing protein-containing protein [Cytidiella melzeri]|nr:RlpA-like double-psi beta-barrel-protein domain-containing protein-containing protein [Cytidiella melzeri]